MFDVRCLIFDFQIKDCAKSVWQGSLTSIRSQGPLLPSLPLARASFPAGETGKEDALAKGETRVVRCEQRTVL
jgi:hypothetical protein